MDVLSSVFSSRPDVWLTFVLVILMFVVYKQRVDRRTQLPGPWGLPIVGYLPFLGGQMNLTLDRLAKRYGNVFQLQLGSRKVVVISGQETIRKALLNNVTVFAGRPDFYTFKAVRTLSNFVTTQFWTGQTKICSWCPVILMYCDGLCNVICCL